MAESDGQRFEELVTEVLGPVVLGGSLTPVRPFGPSLALRLGEHRTINDVSLRSQINVARVRQARLAAPVDVLPEIDAPSIALTAALNDLLQATNHEIGGRFTAGRYGRLLSGVVELCEHIAAPRTALEALARHTTFARVLELTRTDTTVAWWTGKASFRGQPPPSRLLAWRGLRRVQVDEQRIALVAMCQGFRGADESGFCDALGVWLTRSPLTDLATAGRSAPRFGWSRSTISLVATTIGRTLALRLLARRSAADLTAIFERAAAEIPAAFEDERALAASFVAELSEGQKALTEQRARPEHRRSAAPAGAKLAASARSG